MLKKHVNDAQQAVAYADMPRRKKRRLPWVIGALLVLAMLAFGGGLGYYEEKHKTDPVTERSPGKQEVALLLPSDPSSASSISVPSPSPLPPPPIETAQQQPLPQANKPSPPPLSYTDSGGRFSFIIPTGWNIATAEESATTKVLYNPITREIYGQIDRYNIPAIELYEIEQQVSNSPDVTSVKHVIVSELLMLEVTHTRSQIPLLILIKDQTLYYISGKLTESSVRNTIEFK